MNSRNVQYNRCLECIEIGVTNGEKKADSDNNAGHYQVTRKLFWINIDKKINLKKKERKFNLHKRQDYMNFHSGSENEKSKWRQMIKM